MTTTDGIIEAARPLAAKLDADVYLYNGPISRGLDLKCIQCVSDHRSRGKAVLILVTGGGDPDAAYKISRYLQDRYDHFTLLVSGWCKSAGTLIALGAHELAFMPFGELGPLDIQVGRVDRFDAPQSGLAIQEALATLEAAARRSFDAFVSEYMQDNGGILSFPAASRAASDFVTNLYAPMVARIDPEEVGARSRSMRIAHEYGQRLAVGSQNLKTHTLTRLAEKYPSHSFVIDLREAEGLFNHVRRASDTEKTLVLALGQLARFPRPLAGVRSEGKLLFETLSTPAQPTKEVRNAKAVARGGKARDGGVAAANAGAAKPVAREAAEVRRGSRRRGRANGSTPAP